MNENAKKWVEALRSGEFEQTRGAIQDRGGYCCLGIGVVVYERETGARLPRETSGFFFEGSLYGQLDCVGKWLGLDSSEGDYIDDEGGTSSLASLNDDEGWSFESIAELIESEPEGLFVE